MGSYVNNIAYSTRQDLPNNCDIVNQESNKRLKDYVKRDQMPPYENYFLSDAQDAAKISPQKQATVACLSVIDPHTNRGIIGLLNDSSGGDVAGSEFKARFGKALLAELKEANVKKPRIYDHKVEFVLVLEGRVDQKTMASIFKKAIDKVNPEFQVMINGKKQTIKFFERNRMPPEVKFGSYTADSACSAAEFEAATGKLFELVRGRQFGQYYLKNLLKDIKVSEPWRIKNVNIVDANWKFVEEHWNNIKFAFNDCNEYLPHEFEEMLRNSKENYGIEIDPRTKEYLLFKNRQRYVDNPTGALNKAAFNKIGGKVLAEKPANTWIAAGDIYNVTALNDTIGRTLTDNYLKTFVETWKEVANRFGVNMEVFRVGGDEMAFIIRGADAEKIIRMNIAFNARMNAKKVLPEELLARINKNDFKLLLKTGIIEKCPGGKINIKDVKYGDLARKYSKIKDVITKGSQYSFTAENITSSEKRLDLGHLRESLMKSCSDHANKIDSKTTVILKLDKGFVVMEPGSTKCYSDYSMHRINPSSDNIKAVKNMVVNDPKAQLISSENPSTNIKVETYRSLDGKEVTIQTEIFRDRVEIKTGDKLMKLKSPANPVSSNINLNKALFKNPDEIYKWIDEMKKKGWSDSHILNDAIKRLEEAGQAKYVEQVKLLNKLGKIAAPLGVAAALYGIHMINTAPIEERGELFAGFASGFGAFTAGARAGYAVTPGNPLWKAGGGLVLGTAFAVIGDAAMKKFIDSNPKIKEILQSRKMQAILGLMQILDPFSYVEAVKDSIIGTEFQRKNKIVAEYGVDGWDRMIERKISPLKEKLAFVFETMKDPQSTANEKQYIKLMREYSSVASQIQRLEAQKYNIDDNKMYTEEYKSYLKKELQKEAETGSMSTAVKG